jgi:hypothetical protein
MPRYDLWACRILPRIGLDQRSREARLQLERIEWLLIPPAAGKRRLFGDGRGGDGTLQSGRIRRLLKARSSRVPPIVETRRMEMALSQVSPSVRCSDDGAIPRRLPHTISLVEEETAILGYFSIGAT